MLMIPRQTLEREGMMKAIVGAITKGTTEYSVGDLSIPGLRHFLFKSRPQVQVTAPKYEEPYDSLDERRRFAHEPLMMHDFWWLMNWFCIG